ncbi:dephospho-CoA kinase, partial [Streptomyces bacillaris]|uniref:dephospho-CoA kinase n=1 Tax=Streptomyces bacillaris TaxID=68179 RepID=UPI00368D8C2A
MLKVGLTGGIGAGKSEVSRLLVSYGAVLIDSDRIAREVVGPRSPPRGGRGEVLWEGGRGPPRARDPRARGGLGVRESARGAAAGAAGER